MVEMDQNGLRESIIDPVLAFIKSRRGKHATDNFEKVNTDQWKDMATIIRSGNPFDETTAHRLHVWRGHEKWLAGEEYTAACARQLKCLDIVLDEYFVAEVCKSGRRFIAQT